MGESRSTTTSTASTTRPRTTTRTRTATAAATGKVSGRTASSATPAAGKLGTDVSGASAGQLVGEIAADLSTLMRKEVELARTEIAAEAAKAGKGAGLLGGAGYAAHLVALFGSLALVFGIGHWMSLGWAALIVTGLWALVAALLAVKGRNTLKSLSPKPDLAVESLKEDAQWVRHPRS
jgi:hypothetical protein